MQFRRFHPDDAEFCFGLRNRVIRDLFQDRLQPEEVVAATSAYQPVDYIRMAGQGALFIVEQDGRQAGFFYLQRIDATVAELCLIYIEPRFHGQGIGRACIDHIDRWVSSHWEKVATLIVVTFVPGYNASFYQKVGFAPQAPTVCTLSGLAVEALRLCKPVGSSPQQNKKGGYQAG